MLSSLALAVALLSGLANAQKKGIIYTSGQNSNVQVCSSGCTNINWAYDYSSKPGGSTYGLEFVPMLYNANSATLSTWASDAMAAVSTATPKGSKYVLGFNEPDGTQNSISPQQAATLWQQYMNQRTNYKKVSPAVQGGSNGLTWLSFFLNACAGNCIVDYVAVHWHGVSTDIAGLQKFVDQAVSQFSPRPVWVTEFGFTDGNNATAIAAAIRYLGGNHGVFRYAYFECANGYLLSGTAQSAAGRTYCTTTF
nr:hypothetical protein B0A51_11145 [Rachicladosporium sp. CCFEE 5018]